MNSLIKAELNKVEIAQLPDYNDDTLNIIINKGTRDVNDIKCSKGGYYHIKMKDYIVHPYDGFNLHIQWNNNVVPKDDEMNVEVLEVMGNMIKVSGTGVNIQTQWTGWLPVKSIEVIKVL